MTTHRDPSRDGDIKIGDKVSRTQGSGNLTGKVVSLNRKNGRVCVLWDRKSGGGRSNLRGREMVKRGDYWCD